MYVSAGGGTNSLTVSRGALHTAAADITGTATVCSKVTLSEYGYGFTAYPTGMPTFAPSANPTAAPTKYPTAAPTDAPTDAPTAAPTDTPTANPTAAGDPTAQ